MATRRWLAGGALLALTATVLTGRRLEPCVRGLPLDLAGLVLKRGAPLALPRPILHRELELAPSPIRLQVLHHGTPLPARAAARVGEETWIATPAGVLRYGPELWRDPSRARPRGRIDVGVLTAPGVNVLRVLGPDRVLLGTDDGLLEVDGRGRPRGAPRLRGERVTALSRAWIGTWSGLRSLRSLERLSGSEDLRVTDLLDCGERLLVATHDRGLLQVAASRIAPLQGVPSTTRVASLAGCLRGCGAIHAASLGGVYAIDPRTLAARLAHQDPQHATRVLVARDGALLLGSFDAGLRRLAPGAARTTLHAATGPVSLLHPGPEGALLLGDARSLVVLGTDGVRRPLSLAGPPAGMVTAIALEQSRVWAGSFDGGLGRLERDGWQAERLLDPRVTALALDPGGRLLVGTASGLLLLNAPGQLPVRVRDPRGWLDRHIAALRPAPEGSVVWVAAHPGVVALETARERPGLDVRYFGAAGKEADAGLAGPTVYGLAIARDGIWVATDEGLSRMQLGSTRTLTDLGGELPDNWLNDVRIAEDGTLYVLTLRSGLLRIGEQGTRVLHGRFMTSPGVLLPISTPRGRAVLLGSNADGLIVLDDLEGSAPRARTYSLAQGLPAQTVSSFAYDAEHDRLWVGGDSGITQIDGAARQLGIGAASEPTK